MGLILKNAVGSGIDDAGENSSAKRSTLWAKQPQGFCREFPLSGAHSKTEENGAKPRSRPENPAKKPSPPHPPYRFYPIFPPSSSR
jgi:hypothetical protein